MDKLRAFFKNYRRKVIQVTAAVVYNLNLKGFSGGTISRGTLKAVCVPGLNCYSCPGAVASCPLGSLQASLNRLPNKLPLYVAGTLLLFGVLLGRGVCAFLCPVGLIQELLYLIPTKKLKKSGFTRRLSALKYVFLGVFVLFIPVFTLMRSGVAVPGFCKYICPAGTLEGGIPLVLLDSAVRPLAGILFWWKVALLAALIISSVFIYRPFCRFVCPLGAIYSAFNRTAVLGVQLDEQKCTRCGACAAVCKLDVRRVNDRECIRCGECANACPFGAISSARFRGEKKSDEKRADA